MLGLLRKEGWQLTPDPEQADAILVSTCAFLQSSIEESIDEILECADYKSGRCKRLIVAGCLPSRFRDQMAELKASARSRHIPHDQRTPGNHSCA